VTSLHASPHTYIKQLREETASLRSNLTQKSISLKQAVAMNEDIMQQKSQQLYLAREEKGSAEHTIQAQKESMDRLQQELANVSRNLCQHSSLALAGLPLWPHPHKLKAWSCDLRAQGRKEVERT
jgi:chromosome segregation ATPase